MIDVELEEIMAELDERDPWCPSCDKPTTTTQQWDRASAAEKMELMSEGYVAPGRRGLCRRCYNGTAEEDLPAPRSTAAPARAPELARRRALIHNRDELVARGWGVEEACAWLGVDQNTLTAYERRASA